MNKKAMYNLTYGLFVLTSSYEGKDSGCIINTAGQVTSEPNRISIAVNKGNFTHDLVRNSGQFNISILSEAADFEIFKHFGFQSGRTVDKFAGYADCRRSENGLYYVTAGTNGYISGTVEQEVDLGTHTLFIASVRDLDVYRMFPRPAMLIISRISSQNRKKQLRRERQSGDVRSAVIPMRGGTAGRLYLSALQTSGL